MKLGTKPFYSLTLALAFNVAIAAFGQAVQSNPYASIVDRNPFGLKPPPPPPSEEDVVPITPPAQVTLTGLITMFGPPRALFEITEQEGGKAAQPKKPILSEGERMGSVEVLAIDVEKNQVRIRNGPVVTNITFAVAKASTGAPPMPGAPALPIPGGIPAAAARPTPGFPGAPGIGGTPPGQNPGVTVLGGGSSASAAYPGMNPAPFPVPPPTGSGNPAAPENAQAASGTAVFGGPAATTPPANAAGAATQPGESGMRILPSRRLRTVVPNLPAPQTSPPQQ